MKKMLAFMLSLALFFTFAACSEAESADSTTLDQTTAQETTQPEVFEQVTIADNEHFSLTVLDVYEDEVAGYTMKVNIQSKSADTNYSLILEECSINGIAVSSCFFSCDLNAGKRTVEEINYYDEILKNNGVGEYTDIEMVISVNTDLFTEEAEAEYTVHYYPLGKENTTKHERQLKDTDKVLIDNEYMTVVATMITYDEEWECHDVNLYVENKTDEDIILDALSLSINDMMIESIYLEMIPAGKCSYSSIEIDNNELKEKGIEEIENLEIQFEASGEYDYEELFGDVEDILTGDISVDDILSGAEEAVLFRETVVYNP